MQCPQCKSGSVIVEGIDGGGKRVSCHECGYSQVQDTAGRQLLTDDQGSQGQDRRRLLNEAS